MLACWLLHNGCLYSVGGPIPVLLRALFSMILEFLVTPNYIQGNFISTPLLKTLLRGDNKTPGVTADYNACRKAVDCTSYGIVSKILFQLHDIDISWRFPLQALPRKWCTLVASWPSCGA